MSYPSRQTARMTSKNVRLERGMTTADRIAAAIGPNRKATPVQARSFVLCEVAARMRDDGLKFREIAARLGLQGQDRVRSMVAKGYRIRRKVRVVLQPERSVPTLVQLGMFENALRRNRTKGKHDEDVQMQSLSGGYRIRG